MSKTTAPEGEFDNPPELLNHFDVDDLYLLRNSTWSHGSSWVVKYRKEDNRYTDPTVYSVGNLSKDARDMIEALGIEVK